MNKKELSERDICTKFITPALRQAGWDDLSQLREEVSFTKGRIIVRGKMVTRGKAKRADYILYYKPNIPLAVIEAKDNNCHTGDGLQQALEYAEMLQIPFVFSSNGDGFVSHDRTLTSGEIERTLALEAFPSPEELWKRYREWKGLPAESDLLVLQDYYSDGGEKGPRYYQASAVNAAIEAIAKGQNRLLLVMATGTGKTYTAFQIIWRLCHIAILKPAAEVNVTFLSTLLASPMIYSQAKRSLTGTAQPTIPLRPLRNFLVCVPPLDEQRRIVAKVDELMAACDQLEAQLDTAKTERQRLLESLLFSPCTEIRRTSSRTLDAR